MRTYGRMLIISLLLTVALTGCYPQRAEPSWNVQWQAILHTARAYHPDAIPYKVRADPVGDDSDVLAVAVTFFVDSQHSFEVKYVSNRVTKTRVIERDLGSIDAEGIAAIRADAELFDEVAVGPQEALRTVLALPAVQDFIAAYDDAPSGTSLFAGHQWVNEFGSPTVWTFVQEVVIGEDFKSLRVWVDARTGTVLCMVTDGSLSNGCMPGTPTN